jgi:hypothetical protein
MQAMCSLLRRASRYSRRWLVMFFLGAAWWAVSDAPCAAQVCNLKIVTDANPDYSDMDSLIHSVTAPWPTTAEKCWAMFYWNHIARRQTSPMILHGRELTDPIRQFNDYGYMMCSTIAGTNCAIWHRMGLPVRFWDITLHTVSECFYDDRWHMYDNSMSAIYTLCDGVTIAAVEEIGQEGACAASDGRREPGHIAKYHCLNATSENGFLTGADTIRDLAQEYRCFNPNGLKHRWYYNNWDWGHRYILNLRPNEEYTRSYHSLGDGPEFYVPNNGKDPEAANRRYRLRGNGVWKFEPSLTPKDWRQGVHQAVNAQAVSPRGLCPERAAAPAEIVFKVASANVTTGLNLSARLHRRTAVDAAEIAVSTNNGVTWRTVWTAEETGRCEPELNLVEPVNGAYETLVRFTLLAASEPRDVLLEQVRLNTTTMLNSKTQPSLRLGRNTVYVGAGEQTDSIVLWPDLQGQAYKSSIVAEQNIATADQHPGYQGVLYAERPNEEAWVVYRIDAPEDISRLTYGGRFYNRAPGARIQLFHSFDDGRSWQETYTLDDTQPPWDAIHYSTVEDVPAGTRSALVKYSLKAREAGRSACSIYAMRMEVNHRPIAPGFHPLEVTFRWNEVQQDRSLELRSHTQRIDSIPARYVINTGGADQPIVESLQVRAAGPADGVPYGYSDGVDAGGERFQHRWVTWGKNLLVGKPYTVTRPPTGQWGGDDPENKKLTDGVVGPPYPGGTAPMSGAIWDRAGGPVDITADLGSQQTVAVLRIHLTGGYPWWQAMKGQVKDEVEVLVSTDGEAFSSLGRIDTDVRRRDVPINHLLPDDETTGGWNFALIPPQPVEARYIRYRLTPQRAVAVTEIQALRSMHEEPFDLRIALPDEK